MENSNLRELMLCGSRKTIKIGVLGLSLGVLLFCTVVLFPIGFVLAVAGAAAVILGTIGEWMADNAHRPNRRSVQLQGG